MCSWTALFVVALIYSNEHPHSHWIMRAALPAFLIEAVFYVASVFEETRASLRKINSRMIEATILWASALVPFFVFSFGTATFHLNALVLLALLCGVLAYWHVLLPRRAAFDFGFLVIAAAPVVLRVFSRIYLSPDGHTRTDILGHLTWIRLGIAALLVLREWQPGAFGFWPRVHEWKIGVIYFLLVLVPLCVLGIELRTVEFAPIHGDWWRVTGVAAGYFLGALWVIALSEELFFRGVIERALLNQWRSPVTAILLSAILFGAAHLWFRRFPNWNHAFLAAILGIGCGLAYVRTGSVRSSMVTHACVVTIWRVLFR
ncbi:MAG: CPBP family intramembrane metalloprotease [Acidobacteriaceae bacterium]|nr:CPBP family intramembrane metalloprotease [Acidobacteriaceae bacterium]MBV9780947.1 CPBP family intramembrane metalloprotease [Acidobacteriaceae bacterium]